MFGPFRRAVRAGGFLLVPAVLAVALAEPLVFPSLGPSAYLLAVRPDDDAATPRRVVVGHTLGALAGFVAYHLVAAPATLVALPPAQSLAMASLIVSATLSVVLTTTAMEGTDARHAPAAATTLIVSLGLLATPLDVLLIVFAVAALVGTQLAFDAATDHRRVPT